MNDVIRSRAVGRNGNIIHHRYTKERLYVGIVGLGRERIPEKDYAIDLLFRDFRKNAPDVCQTRDFLIFRRDYLFAAHIRL